VLDQPGDGGASECAIRIAFNNAVTLTNPLTISPVRSRTRSETGHVGGGVVVGGHGRRLENPSVVMTALVRHEGRYSRSLATVKTCSSSTEGYHTRRYF
jgi:hypothetical protein